MNDHEKLVIELQIQLKAAGFTQEKTAALVNISKDTLRGYYKRKDMPLRVYCLLKNLIEKPC